MRQLLLVFLLFSLFLIAEESSSPPLSLSLAPLIPLEPEFPLELSERNRDLWIENPKRMEKEIEGMQDFLEEHTFPWLPLLLTLGFASITWMFYLTKVMWLGYANDLSSYFRPPLPSRWQQLLDDFNAFKNEDSKQGKESSYNVIFFISLLRKIMQERWKIDTEHTTAEEIAKMGIEVGNQGGLKEQKEFESMHILLQELEITAFSGKKLSSLEKQHYIAKIENMLLLKCAFF